MLQDTHDTQDTASRPSRRWSRSAKGCVTCARSKVKCSENRPICQRCSRLQRHCEWREHHVPLRERRRGLGSVKSRLRYVPPPILPAHSIASHSVQVTPESEETFVEWETSPSQAAVEATESMASTDPFLNRAGNTYEQATMAAAIQETAAPPLATLNARHIPSRCSILFGPLEQDALYFFENVFSTLSPKTFLWSKLAIVLHHAYDDAKIMHLLLASCLSAVAQSHSDHLVLQTAKSHFKRGTTIFVDGMQEHSYNHAHTFMAFWLLQLTYRAIGDDKSRSAMKNLSTALVDYAHRHHILGLFSSNRGLYESLGGSASYEGDFPADCLNPKKSLLASLLLFTAYEDLDSELRGSGGQFASLILSGDDTSRSLFACSRNIHADFIGSSYPWEELMDDVERSRPLELHFFANTCLNRLNRAHACGIDTEELQKIEENLRKLREVRR
ncbi:hypothetical protein CKAH01_12220 [Colletotrichum kahawae]|uniref:Zn(2)-C6 fungal-type domain-containing protein n=1 Tax=Colletotrichum kahawae TaxID=34407 RepID=A0AAD9YS48_COLKA|nr:hypothetical protein CKAH01_12220 [Colletotrichum kahawae]